MIRRWMSSRGWIIALLGLLLLLPYGPGTVVGADDDKRFGVDPNHRGLGALATWLRDAGAPGQKGDPKQFGLYLQKHTLTTNIASAQAEITKIVPMDAADLDVLAFDISGRVGTTALTTGTTPPGANGYCDVGAPRFVVTSSVTGTHFLGCGHGDKTQDPVTGWWEIKFVSPFTQYPGFGAAFTTTETITRIRIVFDHGNDSGRPGDVVIDNIRVNDRLVGKPSGDDD